MNGVFDIAFDHPDCWAHGNRASQGIDSITVGEDRLDADLCRFGDKYFIRCVLHLQIIGAETDFSFGVWLSAAEDDFLGYVSAWRDNDYANLDGWAGSLANDLPGFPGLAGIDCHAIIRDPEKRPEIIVPSDCHPLALAQRIGITFDQLIDIYEASGHDIRRHLTDA